MGSLGASASAGLESGVEQKSSPPVPTAAFEPTADTALVGTWRTSADAIAGRTTLLHLLGLHQDRPITKPKRVRHRNPN